MANCARYKNNWTSLNESYNTFKKLSVHNQTLKDIINQIFGTLERVLQYFDIIIRLLENLKELYNTESLPEKYAVIERCD